MRLLLGVGLFIPAACEERDVILLQVGSSLPEDATSILQSASGVRQAYVAWVFRPEDCLSCQAATRFLRQLQPIADSLGVGLVAVNVGDPKSYVVEYLRRDRLDAVKLVQGGEARPFAPLRPIPSLIVVVEDRVAELLPVKAGMAADSIQIREVVLELMKEGHGEERSGEARAHNERGR